MSNLNPKEAAANRLKICLLWGFISALAAAFLTFGLYFAGLQADVHGLNIADRFQLFGGLSIATLAMIFGTRAARATVPPWDNFGYGSALWSAFRVGIFACVFGTVLQMAYFLFINPGLRDLRVQQATQKAIDAGRNEQQAEMAGKITEMMTNPFWATVSSLIAGAIIALLIGLIVAIFAKREGKAVMAPQPPPL